MISAIIFDFWGVIINDLYWNWLRRNIKDFDQQPELQKHFFRLSEKVDAGEISSRKFHEAVAAETGVTVEQILWDWKNSIVVNQELLDLIGQLKKNYKTAIISNSSDLLDKYLNEYGISKYFDEIVISYKVKLIKPQKEIFDLTLKKLGVSADQAVFIDDRAANVQAAVALGMQGIIFTNNKNFEEALKKANIA